jgi:hypothetical protein
LIKMRTTTSAHCLRDIPLGLPCLAGWGLAYSSADVIIPHADTGGEIIGIKLVLSREERNALTALLSTFQPV